MILSSQNAAVQPDLAPRVADLTIRVNRLESRLDKGASAGVVILFGAFCALWAQNTKRSALQWFVLGVFFNVIAVLVLLAKNSDDLRQAGGEPSQTRWVMLAVVLGLLLVALLTFFWLWR